VIRGDKVEPALRALNAVLFLARAMASYGEAGVAAVLDSAEYLPLLMLGPEDRTEEFRGHLVELADRYPKFKLAVDKFDGRSG
jgi:hypothetical protein